MDSVIKAINRDSTSKALGLVAKSGGIITVGVPLTPAQGFFKLLHIGGGGAVVVVGADGNPIPFRGLTPGSWIPVIGNQVLASAIFDGVTVTTTATNIDWYGGI